MQTVRRKLAAAHDGSFDFVSDMRSLARLVPMLPADFLPICRVECTFIVLDRDAEVCAAGHDTITGMPAHPLEARTLLSKSVCPPVMGRTCADLVAFMSAGFDD